jgi:hypothetical protein
MQARAYAQLAGWVVPPPNHDLVVTATITVNGHHEGSQTNECTETSRCQTTYISDWITWTIVSTTTICAVASGSGQYAYGTTSAATQVCRTFHGGSGGGQG